MSSVAGLAVSLAVSRSWCALLVGSSSAHATAGPRCRSRPPTGCPGTRLEVITQCGKAMNAGPKRHVPAYLRVRPRNGPQPAVARDRNGHRPEVLGRAHDLTPYPTAVGGSGASAATRCTPRLYRRRRSLARHRRYSGWSWSHLGQHGTALRDHDSNLEPTS